MSLRCAISGEVLSLENAHDIVVTPSGYLCLKRLLLTKLSENGGVDPLSDSGRPLSEDDLVALHPAAGKQAEVPPPPSQISSFSGTLRQLANEYDSVLLELFDTRKALQDTRRELSQALYQNDAAIRVLARVSMERDAARQQLQQFQAAGAAADDSSEAPRKKARVETPSEDLPLSNNIPTQDLDIMLTEWEKLHKARRGKSKSNYALPASWKQLEDIPAWHKSTCKGLTAICQEGKFIVTAGKDKHIVVYNSEGKSLGATFTPKKIVSDLDAMAKIDDSNSVLVVAACGSEARVYDSSTQELHSSCDLGKKTTIVTVSAHPTKQHCLVVTKGCKLEIFRIGAAKDSMKHVASFSSGDDDTEYSCGGMHPDGLLYAVGTTKGGIQLWDLKNKNVGGDFSVGNEDAVTALAFSSNGYHFASAHESGLVCVWDMRKGKKLAELNVSGDDLLLSVRALAFHPEAKHLAYGGKGGLHIVMLKEWKVSAIPDVKVASGIVWDSNWIASISDGARAVSFHTAGA